MTGVILSGGRNLRMGRNKAFLKVGDKVIIEATISLFNTLFDEVLLVTNSTEEYQHLSCLSLSAEQAGADRSQKIKIITDIYPRAGSLNGILTGITYSSSYYSFIVACDMPFLNRNLISYLIKGMGYAESMEDYDIILPVSPKGDEPLHALYSKACCKPIENLIKKGEIRIGALFSQVKVKRIGPAELKPLDLKFLSFFNINTPEDLRLAEEIAKKTKAKMQK